MNSGARGVRWALVLTCAGLISGQARGQCEPQWLNGPEHAVPGVDGHISAFAHWDPDGPGPAGEWLVVAGDIDLAGAVIAPNIAAWDGAAWHDLGGGVAGPISSLAVMDGQLYAGGSFWFAGGTPARYIARYDGHAWHGLRAGEQDLSNPVSALAVHDGRLIAAGGFTSAGPIDLRRVGAWDGSTWAPLGGGFGQPVNALAIYRGEVHAAGAFAGHVFRWDGSAWTATGGGVGPSSADVLTLHVFRDELIAAGRRLDGDGLATPNRIMAWGGASWRPLGQGFISADSCCPAAIEAMAIHDDHLIAVGRFDSADGMSAEQAAAWDGAAWSAVAPSPIGQDGTGRLFAAASYADELVLGGQFRAIGSVAAASIVIGDASPVGSWRAPNAGLTDQVLALLVDGDTLLAGGEFAAVPSAQRIGRWDGSSWARLGLIEGSVSALALFEGSLIAGGDFNVADGSPARSIARWSGSAWVELGGGVAGGITTRVDALLVHNGALFAAGLFTSAGGTPAKNIARWDGSAWSALSAGLSHEVYALAVYDGSLIAGGKFTSSGGAPIFHIARWDGAQWRGLARGIDDIPPLSSSSAVYALAIHGELVAAGRFANADSTLAWNIARWNGSRWTALSGGIGLQNDTVYALAIHGGELYAGGEFPLVGNEPTAHITRWDGAGWRPLAEGISPPVGVSPSPVVRALASYRGELVAAGDFLAAGGRASAFWARWGCGPCAADLNGDGLIDFADYLEFLNLYEAQDPRADLNHDDLVDFGDYLEFLNHYDAGC